MGVRAALAIVGQVRQVGVRAALAIVRQVGQVGQVGGLRRLRRLGGLGGLGGKNRLFCKLLYFFLVLSLKLLTFVKSYI
ncbi:hypothetical protein [Capnocytophaga leadbetteri]